ncbi:MAG: ion transporter [Saprospiraceae bacterium]
MSKFRDRIHTIIFETDTSLGRIFDITVLIAIILSVLVVMLESVKSIDEKYDNLFYIIEWFFTIIFTIEYILRLYAVKKPWKYATSFYGIIDLLAILPMYILVILPYQMNYLLIIRILRLLRIFRIFKLVHYLNEGKVLMNALRASVAKITVFISFVILLVMVFGSILYVIEGNENSEQFTSIPRSIYWAIVTITTVGYGDISPVTPLGQTIAAIIMLLGYAVIAVPTGIVSLELANASDDITTHACKSCGSDGHDDDAIHCKYCGAEL